MRIPFTEYLPYQWHKGLLPALIAIAVIALFNSGCEETKQRTAEQDSLKVNVAEPVDRDFADIKNSGILRMITRYNSSSYFLHKGFERGFEYELVKKFADENDLALEVKVLQPGENPYDLLNSGEGDLIAANYATPPERRNHVQFTRPYNLVDQVVVLPSDRSNIPDNIDELEDVEISVRRNSSYYYRLNELKKQGYDLDIHLASDQLDTEAIFYGIQNGEYEATVSDENIFKAASTYMDEITKGPTIAENDTIAWAIRKNAEDLESKMNEFLFKHFRFRRPGLPPKRSTFLNILRQRYFTASESLHYYYQPGQMTEGGKGVLSPYDDLIRSVADTNGVDWKLLTAIMAQESKFNPQAESWAGAVGLMQVLPRYSEVESKEALFDPETNVKEGVRIIKEHLDHYTYMDSTNQWKFALAAYNVGQGHLADARRLAIDRNRNPNEWKPVEESLLMLMQRKYYQNARHGFCRGIETVKYVREIMNRYQTYKTVLAMSERKRENNMPNVLGIQTFN